MPAGACAQVGDRERVPRAGRVAARGPRHHTHRGVAGDDERPPAAERHDDLGHAERAQLLELAVADDRLGLLFGELEDRDVRQERAVEVRVEREGAGAAGSDEAVAVEQHAPPSRDPLQRLRREVAPQQRRDVHPLRPAQRALGLVGLSPRLPDRLDSHLAAAVGVVAEGEGCRLACRRERDREAERSETPQVRAPLRLSAFGHDDGLLTQRPQGACRIPGAAADSPVAAVDEVTRERADNGERSHDPQA